MRCCFFIYMCTITLLLPCVFPEADLFHQHNHKKPGENDNREWFEHYEFCCKIFNSDERHMIASLLSLSLAKNAMKIMIKNYFMWPRYWENFSEDKQGDTMVILICPEPTKNMMNNDKGSFNVKIILVATNRGTIFPAYRVMHGVKMADFGLFFF